MVKKKRLCVFCGSAKGSTPVYEQMAKDLGRAMVDSNLDLVYGGSCIGLMGVIANSVLEHGGKVFGVIPHEFEEREIDHLDLTELHKVKGMHERKALMYDLSDSFLAIPGGFGTLDEICEIATWRQLDFHGKPCAIYNFEGFYDHFIKHLEYTREQGFIKNEHFELLDFLTTHQELKQFLAQNCQ